MVRLRSRPPDRPALAFGVLAVYVLAAASAGCLAGGAMAAETEPGATLVEQQPRSGSSDPPATLNAPLTETGVRDKLQAMGYQDVSAISHDAAGGWTAKAKKDDRTVTLTLGQSGEVMER